MNRRLCISYMKFPQVPPMDSHPHLGPKEKRSRSKSLEGRDPFVWRRAEEGLLGRRPDAAMAEAEHHHSNCNHRDGPAAAAQMYRSKSMANLGGAVGPDLRTPADVEVGVGFCALWRVDFDSRHEATYF